MMKYRKVIYLMLIFMITLMTHAQTSSERQPFHALVTKWDNQGTYYATGHVNGTVRLYQNKILIADIVNAHQADVRALEFSPDGSRLATGATDNVIKIWDTSHGNLVGQFPTMGIIIALSWSPDSATIRAVPATGMDTIATVDISLDSYAVSENARIASSDDIVSNPSGALTAFAGFGSDLIIVDSTSTLIRTLDATPNTDLFDPPNEFTTSIAWHPTQNIIANGKINGLIYLWDLDALSDNTPILSIQANNGAVDSANIPFEYAVRDIAFNADGSHINSISADGTFRTWDSQSGVLLTDTNVGQTIISAAFTSVGDELAYNTYSNQDTPPEVVAISELSCLQTPETIFLSEWPIVADFVITNTDTREIIQPINDSDVINLSQLSPTNVTIQANSSPITVSSPKIMALVQISCS